MSERRLPSIAELPHLLREQLAELPAHYRQMRENLRTDPAALWSNPLTRILVWVIVGIVALLVGRWAFASLTADYRTNSEPPTAMATIHVACTNPDCLAHYATQVPMDFKEWPLKCNDCDQETVHRAALCRKCRHWYATRPGEPRECPHCTRPPEPVVTPRDDGPKEHTDDDEDGW